MLLTPLWVLDHVGSAFGAHLCLHMFWRRLCCKKSWHQGIRAACEGMGILLAVQMVRPFMYNCSSRLLQGREQCSKEGCCSERCAPSSHCHTPRIRPGETLLLVLALKLACIGD